MIQFIRFHCPYCDRKSLIICNHLCDGYFLYKYSPSTRCCSTETKSAPESTASASAPAVLPETISSAESTLLVGSEFEATVKSIVDMGYPRDKVYSFRLFHFQYLPSISLNSRNLLIG